MLSDYSKNREVHMFFNALTRATGKTYNERPTLEDLKEDIRNGKYDQDIADALYGNKRQTLTPQIVWELSEMLKDCPGTILRVAQLHTPNVSQLYSQEFYTNLKQDLLKEVIAAAEKEMEALNNGEITVDEMKAMPLLGEMLKTIHPKSVEWVDVFELTENLFQKYPKSIIMIGCETWNSELGDILYQSQNFDEKYERDHIISDNPLKHLSRNCFALAGEMPYVNRNIQNLEKVLCDGTILDDDIAEALTSPDMGYEATERKLAILAIVSAYSQTPSMDKFSLDQRLNKPSFINITTGRAVNNFHTDEREKITLQEAVSRIPSAKDERAYKMEVAPHIFANNPFKTETRPLVLRTAVYRAQTHWLKNPYPNPQQIKELMECLKDKECREELRQYHPAVYYGVLSQIMSSERLPAEYQHLASQYFQEAKSHIEEDLSRESVQREIDRCGGQTRENVSPFQVADNAKEMFNNCLSKHTERAAPIPTTDERIDTEEPDNR